MLVCIRYEEHFFQSHPVYLLSSRISEFLKNVRGQVCPEICIVQSLSAFFDKKKGAEESMPECWRCSAQKKETSGPKRAGLGWVERSRMPTDGRNHVFVLENLPVP